MSNSLLAALLLNAIGLVMAYAAGFGGLTYRSGWLLVVGALLAFLGLVMEGMSAYEAGRRDREDEINNED